MGTGTTSLWCVSVAASVTCISCWVVALVLLNHTYYFVLEELLSANVKLRVKQSYKSRCQSLQRLLPIQNRIEAHQYRVAHGVDNDYSFVRVSLSRWVSGQVTQYFMSMIEIFRRRVAATRKTAASLQVATYDGDDRETMALGLECGFHLELYSFRKSQPRGTDVVTTVTGSPATPTSAVNHA